MVDAILAEAHERGIPIQYAVGKNLHRVGAAFFIAVGAVLTIASYAATNNAWYPLIYDQEYSFSNLRDAAAVLPLTLLSVGTAASFSIGLGLLSAFHRGGPAWPLLWVWTWWAQYVSTPLLHWLVWIAIFAIHTAMISPVIGPLPIASVPSQQEWAIGITAIQFIPLFAVAFYFVGLLLGRWVARGRSQQVDLPIVGTPDPRPLAGP